MIQAVVVDHGQDGMNGPGFGIVRAVNQAPDAGMNQRSRTHGARFNCSKQVTADQPVIPENAAGFPKGNHLGMRCRIVVGEVAVPASSNDATLVHDNRADGDFAGLECALGATKGLLHPELVGRMLARQAPIRS
jgi:hypothetical protein